MFDNLLFQTTRDLLTDDISKNILPGAILLSGPESSGKLTCALEIARVLACTEEPKGQWQCTCSSCLKHKALNSSDLLLAGPRDCSLEIAASSKTLLDAVKTNASWLQAARYLYIRSIRKLTNRFSPILWEDDDKASKIAPLIAEIDEYLEELDPSRTLPLIDQLEKTVEKVIVLCNKLESSFMYDSLPVSQIRKASAWTNYTTTSNKKVLIIENVDRMQDSVRNAMLKILEEPPADTVFILTTSRRGAVLPTILSRVRTYPFIERTTSQQQEVISRVFHSQSNLSIESYLASFLPVPSQEIETLAREFYESLCKGEKPSIEELVKKAKKFEPRVTLKIFFVAILNTMRLSFRKTESETELANQTIRAQRILTAVRAAYENITIYNQTPESALESIYDRIR